MADLTREEVEGILDQLREYKERIEAKAEMEEAEEEKRSPLKRNLLTKKPKRKNPPPMKFRQREIRRRSWKKKSPTSKIGILPASICPA